MRAFTTMAVLAFAGLAGGNERAKDAPLPDSVAVHGGSSVASVTLGQTEYWKVTLWVEYVALGNRSVIAQVYDPIAGEWRMLNTEALPGQTTSGSSYTVSAGESACRFYWLVPKDSGWGQDISAYGTVDPVDVWIGMYSGDTLKAEATGGVYRLIN
jgi:hypothetical protein